jgi:NADH-quinone oxidoreductase subunit N
MDIDAIILSVIASVPEIIVIVGACVLLMIAPVRGRRFGPLLFWSSLATVIAAAAATFALAGEPRLVYSGMFVVDDFSVFFKAVFYLATGLCVLMSPRYLEEEDIARGEYYVLLLFALSGMMIMASGLDLLSIYVGMELQALCIYVLTGFIRQERRSNEAALKYVILGSVSSGIFLYGMSLVYGITGTTQLTDMAAALGSGGAHDPALVLATVFLVTGLIFKVGAVPLHMWVPDVYEGAPTTITAFMSVGPKAAAFAILLRIFLDAMAPAADIWVVVVAVIAVLTMALGSFVALVQTNIKRMLAYSSIAHAGFVLLGLVAGGPDGVASVMLYLLIYVFMNLGIFAIIIMMRSGNVSGEAIEDYAGFAKSHRGLALLMLIFLFSLASIPPTAGFFAKFYILVALVEQGYVGLAVIAVLLSAVAAFFYIRIVMLMYMKEEAQPFDLALTPSLRLAIAITAAGTVGIGLLPSWFLDLAQGSVFLGIS